MDQAASPAMTPDRLQQIAELYHSVRESSPDRRAALLAQADPELRREVESLLARQDESLPALDAPTMTLQYSGTRLGPYQVESKLGEGGMGEVFRRRYKAGARSRDQGGRSTIYCAV